MWFDMMCYCYYSCWWRDSGGGDHYRRSRVNSVLELWREPPDVRNDAANGGPVGCLLSLLRGMWASSHNTSYRVVVKMAPIGTLAQNCFSRVRRSAGLSFPGRDTYSYYTNVCRAVYLFLHCARFIALSMSFHYNWMSFWMTFWNLTILIIVFVVNRSKWRARVWIRRAALGRHCSLAIGQSTMWVIDFCGFKPLQIRLHHHSLYSLVIVHYSSHMLTFK